MAAMEGTNQNRVAIVTGASRGIGRAVAELLIRQGVNVLAVAQHTPLETTVEHLNAIGPGQAVASRIAIDGSETVAEQIVAQAETYFKRLDYVVNAAGGARVTSALDASWQQWHEDFNVKFWGYLALIRASIPVLKNSGGGVVVNLVGVAGKDPNPNLAIASAVNGALRAVTKNLADELAPFRIRFINVNPGATETDLLGQMAAGYAAKRNISIEAMLGEMRQKAPLGRLPTAADVANVVGFLLSDQASLITGTSVDIDGGVHRGLA